MFLTENDTKYINKELEEAYNMLGSNIHFLTLHSDISENVFQEDLGKYYVKSKPYKGMVKFSPNVEEISAMGVQQHVSIIFNFPTNTLLQYAKDRYKEDFNVHTIVLNSDHSLSTNTDKVLVTIDDNIYYNGVVYDIANIVPKIHQLDMTPIISIECVSHKGKIDSDYNIVESEEELK